MWRAHTSGQAVHGYGITLKGEEDKDWRLDAFHPDANVQQSLTIIDGQDHTGMHNISGVGSYGVFLKHNSHLHIGDICNPENITTFATRVLEETNQQGVDLVVADGVSQYAWSTLITNNISCRKPRRASILKDSKISRN